MTTPFDNHELAELRRALEAMETRAPEAPDLSAIPERARPPRKPVLSRRPVVVAAGAAVLTLALLLPLGLWLRGGAGPADESSTSVTTGSTTSVTQGTEVTTTTAPPQSTTTSPEVTTVSYGSLFVISSIVERTSTERLETQVNRPRLSDLDRQSQARINSQLDAFLGDRLATYLPNPDLQGPPAEYHLDFEVLWLEGDAWPLLSIVYTETASPDGSHLPRVEQFALVFDLVTGDRLTVADMLTPEGVGTLEAMVHQRLAEVIDGLYCCFQPGELLDDVGVAPEGLLVYVDLSFPEEVGPLEIRFPWAEVADLIDMRQRFLARRAVEAGRCSATGADWVLEEQAGLPEPVATKRRAIFEAALACDFEGLGALAGLDDPQSEWSAPGVGGTAPAWQEAEASGLAPLWFLARTLNLPFVAEAYTLDLSDTETLEWLGYRWPAAVGENWSAVPGDERSELAGLYGEQEMAGFASSGRFTGYCLTIRADGTWLYFGFPGD
jgi:hypothetical protein